MSDRPQAPSAAFLKKTAELSSELLDALKAEHEEVVVVTLKPGSAVFKKASRPQYRKFMADREKSPIHAQENLAKDCCLHPGKEVLDTWFDRYPASSVHCAQAVLELSGFDENIEKKVL